MVQKIKAEIHLKKIRNNANAFKNLTKTRLCAVVKANAYGHGAEEVTQALNGVADYYAVALIEEGLAILTAACGKPVLVLTPPVSEAECYDIAVRGLIASVGDISTAKMLSEVCQKYGLYARVHLKINTGMNRYGMYAHETKGVCRFLQANERVRVEGIYSHLYGEDWQTALRQRDLFLQAVGVCKVYFPNAIAHLSATRGSLLGHSFALDMTRVGIGLYGYLPDGLTGEAYERGMALRLQKAMAVYAIVADSREYAFGGAGYGNAYLSEGTKRLTVLRCGYADGFLRKRENGVFGAENNANALCMDACIRKGDLKRGELTPILTDADEIARKTGTISYEVLCAATRRAEFIYDYE